MVVESLMKKSGEPFVRLANITWRDNASIEAS